MIPLRGVRCICKTCVELFEYLWNLWTPVKFTNLVYSLTTHANVGISKFILQNLCTYLSKFGQYCASCHCLLETNIFKLNLKTSESFVLACSTNSSLRSNVFIKCTLWTQLMELINNWKLKSFFNHSEKSFGVILRTASVERDNPFFKQNLKILSLSEKVQFSLQILSARMRSRSDLVFFFSSSSNKVSDKVMLGLIKFGNGDFGAPLWKTKK